MDDLYLEVQVSADGKSAFITDWTFYMKAWFTDNLQSFYRYEKQFTSIRGKHLTIHIKGLGSYERCKSFAIWYTVNSESISTHRLDFVYSKRDKQQKRR